MTTRRIILAGLASLPLSVAISANVALGEDGPQVDSISTSVGEVKIYPVSHASLVLEGGGEVIYVDPVGGAEAYAKLPKPTAILITHGHGDHFDLKTLMAIGGDAALITNGEVHALLSADLKANAVALANGESGAFGSVGVAAIAAHNTTADRMNFHPVGVGNGYVLSFGDSKIYVAGDTEPTPDMLALTDIDVAFLPMNLPYTMTPEQALEAVKQFKPKVLYPYHFGQSDLSGLSAVSEAGVELRLRDWYGPA